MANGRLPSCVLGLASAALLAQPQAPAVPRLADPARVTQPGSLHPRLAGLAPVGPAPADLALERMLFVLRMAPEAKTRLDQLLRDQQDPASPRYHQWLTPDQFGASFGPSAAQLGAATAWLQGQGFSLAGTSRSGLAIAFSGSAAQVGKAFRTALAEYRVDGARHYGNVTAASIPRELAGFASGVASLNDLRRVPLHRATAHELWTDGSNALGPSDIRTIYDLGPLDQAGTLGTGVTIAVAERADLKPTDLAKYFSSFGLNRTGSFTVFHNGADPGIPDPLDEAEADIDAELALGVAPGANLEFESSPSSFTTDGIDLSVQDIVDRNQADVVVLCYGTCEAQMSAAESAFYLQTWAQAAAQGQTVLVAGADTGPAGCENSTATAATLSDRGVVGTGSTPYNLAVGGTEFTGDMADPSQDWASGSGGPTQGTALGYIGEGTWDEAETTAGAGAGSGGVSTLYGMPAWQSAYLANGVHASGLAATGMRAVPDVSASAAADHDPYAIIQEGQLAEFGGTSCATPVVAGELARVVQRFGRQGNVAPILYRLAQPQYQAEYVTLGAYTPTFHDITTGVTSVPGLTGYSAGDGYDLATGLGSLDAANLVASWPQSSSPTPLSLTLTQPAGATTLGSGQSLSFSGSGSDSTAGATLSYTWSFGDGSADISGLQPAGAAPVTATHPYLIRGSAAQTFNATLTEFDGSYALSRSVPVTVTPAGVSAWITEPVTNVSVMPGTPITFDAAATSQNPASTGFSYLWDFGDGSSAQGASVSHTFAENAQAAYTVTLTAKDSTGASATATETLYADTAYEVDVNGDGQDDVRDLLTLAAAWGSTPAVGSGPAGPGQYNGLNFFADMNGDGVIDDKDITSWMQNFSSVTP